MSNVERNEMELVDVNNEGEPILVERNINIQGDEVSVLSANDSILNRDDNIQGGDISADDSILNRDGNIQGDDISDDEIAHVRNRSDCKNYFKKAWDKPAGKTVVVLASFMATYAIISGIVKATSGVQRSVRSRVMPYSNIWAGTYNKDVDDRLRFVTAAVSIQLRNLCGAGEDVSWESLQAVLAQCPVLEADANKTFAQETFDGKFSETDVSTWFYDFVKKHDSDIFDAARIHGVEINEVIQFVENCSVDYHVFSGTDSDSSSLLDIGMIRFPTKNHPHVKLYRLQLKGTFVGSRFMLVFASDQERSLTANVTSRKYYPRDELLQGIPAEVVRNTLETFEEMLTA